MSLICVHIDPDADRLPTEGIPVTLRDALGTRNNALNFVRLLLAGLVIVSHTWPLDE